MLLAAVGNDEADQLVTAMALQATRLWLGAELHLVHVVNVLRRAPCSVLLARAPKYAAEAHTGEICPDCLQAEASSAGSTLRCVRHALEYGRTHSQVGAIESRAS